MTPAFYRTQEDARNAASYITGPQVKTVFVDRIGFEKYQPVIVWQDDTATGMKLWTAEWFSLKKEV